MKVYYRNGQRNMRMYVQPGKEHPETSDFMTDSGARDTAGLPIMEAKLFAVEFKLGEAEVDAPLGKYMLAKGLAQRSPIILPAGVAA
jgi:hypothetical protein